MKNKQDIIQLRVDSELKDKFFELAQSRGESPSNLIRILMQQAINSHSEKLEELAEWQVFINEMLLELISVVHRISLVNDSQRTWEIYKESWLPEYLEDAISQSLKDRQLPGDQIPEAYNKEILKNYFLERKTSSFLKTHLDRNQMDSIREELKKQQND